MSDQNDDSYRALTTIRKLASEEQWETWKWQMQLCLKEQCLETIVSGERKCPDAPKDNEEPSDKYRKWQRDNARAARMIGTALDEEPATYVRKKVDAKDIWDTLVSVFEQSSLQRLYTLFDEFFEVTKDDVTSVTKHASCLSNLFDDILSELQKEDKNAKLPLSLLHHRIFKTLSSEYQYYRSTWYRVPEAERTTKLLIENLRSIESSLTTHVVTSTANVFYTNSKKEAQKENSNTLAKNTIARQLASKKRETRSCFYCKKIGHVIANCRKRVAAEQRAANSDHKGNKCESNSKNNKSSTFVAVSLAFDNDSADSWIADSGTTHHMLANKQHFVTYQKFPIPQRVQTAGNEPIFAYGSGRVDVEVYIHGKWSPASLEDVWYVPDVRHQLFSIRKATQHGNRVLFDCNNVTIKRDSKVVATGQLIGATYVMNMRVQKPDLQAEVNVSTTEDILQGWHERLGHQDKRHVREVLSRFGIKVKCSDTTSFCDGCILGKSHRKPFHKRIDRSQNIGELINADVNGPMSVESVNGFRYYVVFKDDYSRFVQIYFLKHKSEVAAKLKIFLNMCDTEGHKVKVFRSDGGREFDCEAVMTLLRDRGIEFRPTCPDTPEQNGVAEQSNRHIVELARSMLSVSKLPKSLWSHACDTAAFVVNRTGKSSVSGKTPFELWYGKTFDKYNYLRIFGSECYVNIPKKFRSKFDNKAIFGYFVGYVNEKDGYKVWVPSKHTVMKSRNVDFRPEKLCTSNNVIELHFDQTPDDISKNNEPNDNGLNDKYSESHSNDEDEHNSNNESDSVRTSHVVREVRPPRKYADYEVGYQIQRGQANSVFACMAEAVHEALAPTSFEEAIKSQDSEEWLKAMEEEMNAFEENKAGTM